MESNVVEIKGLRKRYKGFALENLDLALPAGCIMGLVGENGAGKSTTIRLIMDAISRDEGKITVLGVDNQSPDFLRTKEDIGVVLDETCIPEVITAKQLGKIMAGTYKNWEQDVYDSWLEKFRLPPDKKFKEYSRGMTMKLGIAAALSHRAKLLLLDEATSGLDPIVRDEVLEIFNEFTREEDHSILISSHILSDLEKLCDYIAFLHRGRLLFCDEKDQLLETYGVFAGTAEQLESLREEAILGRESSGYGGVRALVRREEVPAGLGLERATVEDIILFMVKGAK